MKIGLYISPAHAVPPDEDNILAPWILLAELADGLVSRGHEVHLFAASGSKTKAMLHDFGIAPVVINKPNLSSVDYKSLLVSRELKLYDQMLTFAWKYDLSLLHIHTQIERLLPAVSQGNRKLPVVSTFHDPVSEDRFEGLTKVADLGFCHFISISRAQQRGVPFKFSATVYNGISLNIFGFSAEPPLKSAMYLSVGRIVPEKGFEDAIEAIDQTGERLMLAGQVYTEKADAAVYFTEKIEPYIDRKKIYFEPVMRREHLVGHYQTAKALLFPVKWEEPFGLVMIEAMACGTPVIAYNRGSVPEIVVDGKTGFVVDPGRGVAGLVEAIGKIGEIDRAACRRHVEENFTIEKMVAGYEKVYAKILGK